MTQAFQGLFQDIFKDLLEQVFVVCSHGDTDAVCLTSCQFCKIIILYGVVFEAMVYIPKQVLGLELIPASCLIWVNLYSVPFLNSSEKSQMLVLRG